MSNSQKSVKGIVIFCVIVFLVCGLDLLATFSEPAPYSLVVKHIFKTQGKQAAVIYSATLLMELFMIAAAFFMLMGYNWARWAFMISFACWIAGNWPYDFAADVTKFVALILYLVSAFYILYWRRDYFIKKKS
ncbi:MAG: hypothetical protein QW404_03145 [Candidatus Nanoarchaeia archaeon]